MQKIYNNPRKIYQSWLSSDFPTHINYSKEQMLSTVIRGNITGLDLKQVVNHNSSPYVWCSTFSMVLDGREFDYTFEFSKETGKPIFTVDLDYLKGICEHLNIEA